VGARVAKCNGEQGMCVALSREIALKIGVIGLINSSSLSKNAL